jgi:hypothetical protein
MATGALPPVSGLSIPQVSKYCYLSMEKIKPISQANRRQRVHAHSPGTGSRNYPQAAFMSNWQPKIFHSAAHLHLAELFAAALLIDVAENAFRRQPSSQGANVRARGLLGNTLKGVFAKC